MTGEFSAQRPVTRKMFLFDDVIMLHSPYVYMHCAILNGIYVGSWWKSFKISSVVSKYFWTREPHFKIFWTYDGHFKMTITWKCFTCRCSLLSYVETTTQPLNMFLIKQFRSNRSVKICRVFAETAFTIPIKNDLLQGPRICSPGGRALYLRKTFWPIQ